MENIFYSFDKMLSYNALLNFIIGERGVGKSYQAKKFVAKRFVKKGEQFVYLRRYKTELKEALGKNPNFHFWEQIANDEEVKDLKLTNDNKSFYINGELCGYAFPLSTANILKSSSFEKVKTIIFDEFIIDTSSNYKYLQNEVIQLLDVIETVARLRDIRVIFLGNAISITNPYFTFFDLSIPYNSQFKTFKNGLILVNYIKNLKYREEKKKTKFGQLTSDTIYGKYAIDNAFLKDDKTFVCKKTNDAKFFFTLILNSVFFGVWVDYKNNKMFISNDYDPNSNLIYSLSIDGHTENSILIKSRTHPLIKNIIEHYKMGFLNFENQKIKNAIMEDLLRFLAN